ncbi:MAG: alpha-amylase [Flavobacteriales bacterium]|nr:alpha-amylase [Flavobacteriales bacterium]
MTMKRHRTAKAYNRPFFEMNTVQQTFVGFAVLSLLLASCAGGNSPSSTTDALALGQGLKSDVLVHPAWSSNATIYEVNVRQHTPEGTFNAFAEDLPRLKDLGVDILWLMPIHPIGEVNRKGGENKNNFMVEPGSSSMGSPYSVKDYYKINPDFGTEADLRALTDAAHALDMKVIIDWVANHTAFDNEWTESHLEYFLLDDSGNLQPPSGTDWWDVTQLDWENGRESGLYDAMADALEYWVREFGIDGYRCDVAGKVPTDFWEKARRQLEEVNPEVFMLAEADVPEHHKRAFDMSYEWEMHHIMNQVGKGEWSVDSLIQAVPRQAERFGADAYRMMFITNHDENSWNGTIDERLGANGDAMAVLSGSLTGMPLVYSGQEAGMTKRLRFFEKDTVEWGDYPKSELYRTINALHHENQALWNGKSGGQPEFYAIESDVALAWKRTAGSNDVVVAVNLGDESAVMKLGLDASYASAWGGVAPAAEVEIPAHAANVWTRNRTE